MAARVTPADTDRCQRRPAPALAPGARHLRRGRSGLERDHPAARPDRAHRARTRCPASWPRWSCSRPTSWAAIEDLGAAAAAAAHADGALAHRRHRRGAVAGAAPLARRARLRHRLRRRAVVRPAALVRRPYAGFLAAREKYGAPAARAADRRERRLDRRARLRHDARPRASSTSGARRRPATSARTRACARCG
mgnify:CR=1 FL=1